MLDTLRLQDATMETFRGYFEQALASLPAKDTETSAVLRQLADPVVKWPKIKLPQISRGHLALIPNERLLQNLGYTFSGQTPLISMNDDEYAEAIVASAQPIIEERTRLIAQAAGADWGTEFPGSLDLILAAPAVFRHHYRGNAWWKNQKKPERKEIRDALMAFISQEGYATCINVPNDADRPPGEYLAVGDMLRSELIAFTAGISAMAANNFCSVLRLPPAVNRLFDSVRRLGLCARSAKSNAEGKTHRTARQIAERLATIIPERIREFIARNGHRIKLVSDAPLELLPVGNLPLGLAKMTSRIPATPGNSMLLQNLQSGKLHILRDAFSDILVVRSFAEEDSVGKLLPAALDVLRPEKLGINVSYRDVTSAEEFQTACNGFSGAVLIFDGHGTHDAGTDVGGLVLGGKSIDLFRFRKEMRVPPIVILSACDTHPGDRSHASSGNTFLMLGAMTVLGTVLPIDGRRAALFIARLLLRLGEFLPLYTKTRPATWQEVMLACLRMAYCTELVFAMSEKNFLSLTDHSFHNLIAESNGLISANEPSWFDILLANIEKQSNKSREEIEKFVQRFHQLPDALRYVQLGNPEQIVVVSDRMVELSRAWAVNEEKASRRFE
jgi:hypothetical protein